MLVSVLEELMVDLNNTINLLYELSKQNIKIGPMVSEISSVK